MNRFPIRVALIAGLLMLFVLLGSQVAVQAQTEPVPAAVEAACIPKAKEVVLFEHINYGGKCTKLKIGRYPTPALMHMADNSVTSLKVGTAVRAVLFRDVDYGGMSAAFTTNIPNLNAEPIGHDNLSSLRVEMRPKTGCVPRGNEIAVFEHENYGGECMLHNVGNFSDPLEIGLPDDFISSVKVGNLLRLVLYRDEDFGGISGVYMSDDAALYYDDIGNDKVSSMRVDLKPRAKGCKAGPTQVAFYKDAQYKGQCVVKEIGTYPDAVAIGLDDDIITAFKVGSKVKVILYTGTNFTGFSATYQVNINNLYYQPIGNDTVSSFKIVSR